MNDVDIATAAEKGVELVRVDYETTQRGLDGVVRMSDDLRRLAFTVVLLLLVLSPERDSWMLALVGVVATALFGVLDAYHGWLYSLALRRLHRLERVMALRFKQLERLGIEEDTTFPLQEALVAHRSGLCSNLRRFLEVPARGSARQALRQPLRGAGGTKHRCDDIRRARCFGRRPSGIDRGAKCAAQWSAFAPRAASRDNIRDNIQIVHGVHIVHAAGRSGRSCTIWTYLTPGLPG